MLQVWSSQGMRKWSCPTSATPEPLLLPGRDGLGLFSLVSLLCFLPWPCTWLCQLVFLSCWIVPVPNVEGKCWVIVEGQGNMIIWKATHCISLSGAFQLAVVTCTLGWQEMKLSTPEATLCTSSFSCSRNKDECALVARQGMAVGLCICRLGTCKWSPTEPEQGIATTTYVFMSSYNPTWWVGGRGNLISLGKWIGLFKRNWALQGVEKVLISA